MKSRHPILIALATVGGTVGAIIASGFIITLLIVAFFGDESGAMWFFSFCFVFFAPLVLTTAIVIAVRRFVRDRRAYKAEREKKEPNQAPQRNAGSRPLSDDSSSYAGPTDDRPASETQSSLGPRG